MSCSVGLIRSKTLHSEVLMAWRSTHIMPNEGSIFEARVGSAIIVVGVVVFVIFLPLASVLMLEDSVVRAAYSGSDQAALTYGYLHVMSQTNNSNSA